MTTDAPTLARTSPAARPDEEKPSHTTARRWAWCWLAVGAALLPVTNLQTLVPVAAWLAPVFLLRFTRTVRPLVALPVLALTMSLSVLVGMRDGFFPVAGGISYAVFVAGLGVGGALPYAVDRLLAPRSGPVVRTLVFPMAVTATELLGTVGNPFGTAGSTAYSQYAGLPLLQLVSVTGIWGLTFLVSWLAPVVNEVWERGAGARSARGATTGFVVVLSAVLVLGGARVAFAEPAAPTVRVAALAPDRRLSELAYSAPDVREATPAQREAVRDEHLRPVLDDLLERSRLEAAGGAKIVVWSEAAARVLAEDVPDVLARAADVAAAHEVYLQVSVIVDLDPEDLRPGGPVNENHAVLFDPSGDVVWDYLKSRPTPGDGHEAGPGVVPTVDTPYGRLATIICQDDFFPGLVRQAGRAGVDILLLPSSDWPSLADWHAQQAPFRAVENGMAVVRPTRQGTSLVADAHGRLVAHKADYFAGDDQTLVASVPTRGTDALYPRVGDIAAYGAALALVAVGGHVLLRRRSRA